MAKHIEATGSFYLSPNEGMGFEKGAAAPI